MALLEPRRVAASALTPQETSCKATRAIIEYIRRQYQQTHPDKNPGEIITELLRDFPWPAPHAPYTEAYLTDINNWVELTASDELFQRARTLLQDEDLTYKIAAATPHFPGMFGLSEHLARVVGPEAAMRRTPRLQRALQGTSLLELSHISATRAEIKISYHARYRADLRRDSCDFARGILSALPQFAGEATPAHLAESCCTLPLHRRGVIDGCFHILDTDQTLWQFEWPFDDSGDQIPLPARDFIPLGDGRFQFITRRGRAMTLPGNRLGQPADDGSFTLNGVRYGADSCIYRLTWQPSPWPKRWWSAVRSLLPGGWREDRLVERQHRLDEMAGQVASLELATVYDDIVKRLVIKNSLVKAKVALLTEFDPQTEVLIVRALAMDVWETAISRLGKIDTAIIGRYLSLREHPANLAVTAIHHRQPLLQTEQLRPLFSPLLDDDTCRDLQKRVHWLATLPLWHSGHLLGSLLIAGSHRQPLSDTEQESLLSYAGRTAAEIWNASQYHRRVAELEQLQQINRDISTTLKLDEVLQRILTEALRLLRVSAGRILLNNPQNGDGLARVGQPLPEGQAQSELAAVIAEGERVIGRIEIQSERPLAFDANDQRLLDILAGQAAIAIQNAQQHEALLQERNSRVNAEISAAMADLSGKMIHRMRNHLGGARSDALELRTAHLARIRAALQADVPAVQAVDQIDQILGDIAGEMEEALAMLEQLRKPFKIEIGPTGVQASLDRALGELARRPNVHLHVSPVVAYLPSVTGSEEHLSEIFHILLTNALAALDGNGEIAVSGQVEPGNQVRLTIRDTGCGMSPAVLAQIFNYGFTTRTTHKKSAGGYGFGLWWVKTYLQRQEIGGDISAHSLPGQGSEFTLLLPVWSGQTEKLQAEDSQ